MRRWLQTIAELAVAAMVHLAILAAFGLGPAKPAPAPVAEKRPTQTPERGEFRTRRVRPAGPGHAAASGRSAEDIPGFPVPVAAQGAAEGRAVTLPALAPEQVLNAPDGDPSATSSSSQRKTSTPAPVPRPGLAQDEPLFARGARGDPEWQLPGARIRPLQIFPGPLPGQTPGQPAAKRLPPSGGSSRDAKLALRGFEAAPRSAAQAKVVASAAPEPEALRTSGPVATPAPMGGGGIPGLVPASPEAPSAGAATRGASDGIPAGAAPRGEDRQQEETRPAQARPEPQEHLAERTQVESAASAQLPERAPEDQSPPVNDDLDERRRFSVSVPAEVEVEAPRGVLSPRSSDADRLAGPERESSPEAERIAMARTRAPAAVGAEDLPSTRRMDERRPGEPAPRYRERAGLEADPLTTGPAEGARLTGPSAGPAPEPGADPLARRGETGSAAEGTPQDPDAPFGGRTPSPNAPSDPAAVPVPPEVTPRNPARAEPPPPVRKMPAQEADATHVEVERVGPDARAEALPEGAPATDPASTTAPHSPPDPARPAEQPSPPDSKDLPAAAEAPKSDQRGPHVPRPEPTPEDRPALEGLPGGADTQQPVLLAMAPPSVRSGLEGSSTKLELPGDDRLDPARRALASATQLLELAALEGGEVGVQRAAEATAALAAAEEKLRGLEGPATDQAGAPPQAGAPTDLPAGGGTGNALGSPLPGGSGRLDALAQGRVDYVVSLVGPSAIRRAGRGGTSKVTFRVDERGYVREVAILRSTGAALLDREIEPALHLAEPYAVTSGWLSVVVRFEAR